MGGAASTTVRKMAEVLDADWFRSSAYLGLTLATVAAWRFESNRSIRLQLRDRVQLWPLFWLLVGLVYVSMACAISADLVSTVGGVGRRIARAEEWYESRRPVQVAAVSAVGFAWLSVVVVGIWRVPQRRRRYLPSALLCASLVCFAAIRVVSLHHIDTVVARTDVADVPVGTVIELSGIVLALLLVFVATRRSLTESDGPVGTDGPSPDDDEVTATAPDVRVGGRT